MGPWSSTFVGVSPSTPALPPSLEVPSASHAWGDWGVVVLMHAPAGITRLSNNNNNNNNNSNNTPNNNRRIIW